MSSAATHRLRDGAWAGRTCYIVGGGPSLRGFDWELLRDKLTIAVNRSFETVPEPSIIFGIDTRFWINVQDGKYSEEAAATLREATAPKVCLVGNNKDKLPTFSFLRKKGLHGLSESLQDGLCGGFSGYAAINLALCLGTDTIYLLGFDSAGTRADGTQAHWHGGHRDKQPASVYNSFTEQMEQAAPAMLKRARIINLSPSSVLKCFPFAEFPTATLDPQPCHVKGYFGFGDNLNQRPFVRALLQKYRHVYLATHVPQFYHDMSGEPGRLHFVRANTKLRTQCKTMATIPPDLWEDLPANAITEKWAHHGNDIKMGIGVPESCRDAADGVYDFELPVPQAWKDEALETLRAQGQPWSTKPVCLVHPPTRRKEWDCQARPPRPEYIQRLVDHLSATYTIISIADLVDGVEWPEAPLENVDFRLEHGELSITAMAGLYSLSHLVLCAPGLPMLLGIATRAPTFTVFGGHMPPEVLTHEIQGLERFGCVTPEPFCFECYHKAKDHVCNTKISEGSLLGAFMAFHKRVCGRPIKKAERIIRARPARVSLQPKTHKAIRVGMPAGIGDMHWVLTKMESIKEREGADHLTVVIHEDRGHLHSADFLRPLPFIDAVESRPDNFNWKWHLPPSERNTTLARNVEGVDLLIELNSELEQGHKLEDVLPEYEINWDYEIPYAKADRAFALDIRRQTGSKMVVLYASSLGGQHSKGWIDGTWTRHDWAAIAHACWEAKCAPVLIGASWDLDFAGHIVDTCETPIINLVGKTKAHEAMALIRSCHAFAGFPSGMSIMATHFGKRTVMFWPRKKFDPGFATAWVSPERLAAGTYHPMQFGSKDATAEGVIEALEIAA